MTDIEYLLTALMEECAEVQQCICKIQRFGFSDRWPADAPLNNLQKLQLEYSDMLATTEMLEERGVQVRKMNAEMIDDIIRKKQKLLRFMDYSRRLKILGAPICSETPGATIPDTGVTAPTQCG